MNNPDEPYEPNEIIKSDYVPEVDDIASFVDSLKIYLKNDEIKDENIKNIVKSLPSPRKIKMDMSKEECKIIFETVRWAWKEITGKDLIELSRKEEKPETLMGNYWMLKNGLLLHGTNHYTMVKQNTNIFSSLLNINGLVLQEKLSRNPEQLIKTIIDYGAVRMFISKDKRSYFQMNDKIYAEWGRNKVKKLDFKNKIVKLIDKKCNYKGWSSGITIIL